MQQVEHFNNPGITQNDGFKSVVRYFDRITRPEQIISSLQQATQVMLDPADCGPACISLSQDVQGEVYDYPEDFFKERIHTIRRPFTQTTNCTYIIRIIISHTTNTHHC